MSDALAHRAAAPVPPPLHGDRAGAEAAESFALDLLADAEAAFAGALAGFEGTPEADQARARFFEARAWAEAAIRGLTPLQF